jgi:hypothetical protein
MSTIASVTVKSEIHFLFFPPPSKNIFSRGGMEGTSTEENLLMREIEDHPVVSVYARRTVILRQTGPVKLVLKTVCLEKWRCLSQSNWQTICHGDRSKLSKVSFLPILFLF